MEIKRFYEFGNYIVDPAQRVLLKDGAPVQLAPKAFDTLLVLIEGCGNVVGRKELLEKVWPDAFVEEQNLTFNISVLRKTLSDSKDGERFIETVPKRGYRFVPSIQIIERPVSNLLVETRTLTRVTTEERVYDSSTSELALEPATGPTGSNEFRELEKIAPEDFLVHDETRVVRQVVEVDALPSPGRARRRKIQVAVYTSVGIVVLLAAFITWKWSVARRPSLLNPVTAFQSMQISRLTSAGSIRSTAISPDGKYVVYVLDQVGQQSLWIRHSATASNAQIMPPKATSYASVAFSMDGNYVYYVEGIPNSPMSVYRIPVLGGTPARVIDGVDSHIALSPDGRQIAFARVISDRAEHAIIVADLDGGNERTVVTRKSPETLSSGGPAWSPDGKSIAYSAGSSNTNMMSIFIVDAQGSQPPRRLTETEWFRIEQMAWLSDGSGLLFLATPSSRFFYQVWHIDAAGGEAHRLTNDLNNYSGLSLTANSDAMVTVKFEQTADLWLAKNTSVGFGDMSQLTNMRGAFSGGAGMTFMPDGRIAFTSNAGGNDDVWIINPDGSNLRQVTSNARLNWQPAASADGKGVAVLSDRNGVPHIWEVPVDGGAARQLTNGLGENNPCYTPDARWLVFSENMGGKFNIWKMSVDGQRVRLTESDAVRPAASPDGKLVAFWFIDDKPGSNWKLGVVTINGEQVKTFEPPASAAARGFFGGYFFRVRWLADSKAITYIDRNNGVSNIWEQSLEGGAPRQLTKFNEGQIFDFNWSTDGRLALARGSESSDVIMLSDLK